MSVAGRPRLHVDVQGYGGNKGHLGTYQLHPFSGVVVRRVFALGPSSPERLLRLKA